ncbi:hypothetical protein [Egbenema bharatensis]|uniref:hypothetical protein n=1 Tax=Egbenema bharatensis TaxID=3463334 RepID=UPI003A8521F0
MVYPTLEVRWFLREPIPEGLEQYFQQGPQPGAIVPTVEARQDWYLRLTQQDDLGIKLREGKVEIKKRVGDRGFCQLSDQVAGRVEDWVKWSFSSEVEVQAFLEEAMEEWMAVQKTRRQKTYQMLSGKVTEVIDPAGIASGCTLEVATLEIQNQTWFSLGFEAFGECDRRTEVFDRVVQYALARLNFLSLPIEQSFSYPRWLSAILTSQIEI